MTPIILIAATILGIDSGNAQRNFIGKYQHQIPGEKVQSQRGAASSNFVDGKPVKFTFQTLLGPTKLLHANEVGTLEISFNPKGSKRHHVLFTRAGIFFYSGTIRFKTQGKRRFIGKTKLIGFTRESIPLSVKISQSKLRIRIETRNANASTKFKGFLTLNRNPIPKTELDVTLSEKPNPTPDPNPES